MLNDAIWRSLFSRWMPLSELVRSQPSHPHFVFAYVTLAASGSYLRESGPSRRACVSYHVLLATPNSQRPSKGVGFKRCNRTNKRGPQIRLALLISARWGYQRYRRLKTSTAGPKDVTHLSESWVWALEDRSATGTGYIDPLHEFVDGAGWYCKTHLKNGLRFVDSLQA